MREGIPPSSSPLLPKTRPSIFPSLSRVPNPSSYILDKNMLAQSVTEVHLYYSQNYSKLYCNYNMIDSSQPKHTCPRIIFFTVSWAEGTADLSFLAA